MPPLEKATLTNTVTGDRFALQFNPEELSDRKDMTYAPTTVPGLSAPILQFVSGNQRSLEMELFLDTYEEGRDVREESRKITGLMEIEPETHAPPVLVFTWASLSFTCVLASASQRFIMFLPDGRPCRARLQVTFNEFRNVELEAKEIKRETADYTRRRVVSESESLWWIAHLEYGDPALWRLIASRNRLDDPIRLPVGREVEIPRLPFRDPETGKVYE